MGMIVVFVACTEIGENEITFEERIKQLLEEENIGYDAIIDYDLKDNYIYVFYRGTGFMSFNVSVLNQNPDGLEFILSQDLSVETTVVGDGEIPYVTVIQKNDPSIKQVKVLGLPARKVIYPGNIMEGVTIDTVYWVAYSYTMPLDQKDAIEIFRE